MISYTFLGTLFLFVSTLVLCKGVFSYYDKTLLSYDEILRFLYSLRQKISSSSLSPNTIILSDDGYDLLVSSGFFDSARNNSLHCAFGEAEQNIFMYKEDKELIKRYLSSFGTDMLAAELENLSLLIDTLEKKNVRIKKDIPSKKKVASTMIACCAMMLIILII